MKNTQGTPKRVTYAFLEKQNRLGKELLMRVTKQLSQKHREIEALTSQLKVSQSIIGMLAEADTRSIDRAELSEFIKTKQVTWDLVDEGKAIQIIVKEADTEVDESGECKVRTIVDATEEQTH